MQFRTGAQGLPVATDQGEREHARSVHQPWVHGSFGDIVKPVVAGPGGQRVLRGQRHGDGRMSMSGTSMATPHVAGIVALTFQSHPSWTAPQVKAAVMNTATHDVKQGDRNATLLRQGTGRVDALQAVRPAPRCAASRTTSSSPPRTVSSRSAGRPPSRAPCRSRTPTAVAHVRTWRTRPRWTSGCLAFALSTKRVTAPAHGTRDRQADVHDRRPDAAASRIDPTQESVQSGYQREFRRRGVRHRVLHADRHER